MTKRAPTKRENLEIWVLLDQAVYLLEDLLAGRTSPKDESASEAIARIQKFRDQIRLKITC
jgi:hypothetical protein